jgi:ubiquinone/menaquinone biosynthesis C-methylase UbiE
VRSFDSVASRYEEDVSRSIAFMRTDHAFFLEMKARHLIGVASAALQCVANARVLDVGSGTGLFDAFLHERFGQVEGVDSSAAAVEEARRRNPWAKYVHADAAALPHVSATFDLTFAMCVLHHVEPSRRTAVLGEMARVTRPGGVVLVYEHNPLNPLTRLAVARCAFDDDAVLLRPREVRHLLSGAGLTPDRPEYLLFFPWPGRRLRTIERYLSAVPAGAQYAVAGRA